MDGSPLAFRITATFDSLNAFTEMLCEHASVVAIYQHTDQSRPHIHGYVEGLTVGTDTLKNWIKKTLGVSSFPKSDWEFATKIAKGERKGNPVDRNALTYFHKGKYECLKLKGLTLDELNEFHSKSYVPVKQQQKVQFKLVSESKEQAHKRQKDLLEEMKNEWKIQKTQKAVLSDSDIVDIVNTVVRRNNIVMGVYKRIDFYDTLYDHMNEGWSATKSSMLNILNRRSAMN